jgi:hypothetical protein
MVNLEHPARLLSASLVLDRRGLALNGIQRAGGA